MNDKNKYSKLKKAMVVLLVFLAVGLVVFMILRDQGNETSISKDENAKTTSTAPTAQEDFTEGNEREPGNTLKENQGSGTIEDTGGNIDENTETANALTSASGEITVYAPAKNATIKSGIQVAGISELPEVSYRLIDSVSGVISTGKINVIDGKFSGKLNFTTSAKEGRLDFFGTRVDGSEFSNIEIPLNFE